MQLWDDVTGILKAPVVGELDVKHLFLLIGLIIVIIIAWVMILRTFSAAAEEI